MNLAEGCGSLAKGYPRVRGFTFPKQGKQKGSTGLGVEGTDAMSSLSREMDNLTRDLRPREGRGAPLPRKATRVGLYLGREP